MSHLLNVQVGILRSASRESVATDLSLVSLSSIAGSDDMTSSSNTRTRICVIDDDAARGQSPNPPAEPSVSFGPINKNSLQVPGDGGGGGMKKRVAIVSSESLFEEESDLIRSCAALSSVLGLRRSFSTSDIALATYELVPRSAASETCLLGGVCRLDLPQARLDYASRSCSTWVAVGDMASTSQLPSPQGYPSQSPEPPAFSATELLRSVNKKVRNTYIRRRIMNTYRVLEKLTQSDVISSGGKTSSELMKLLPKDFDPKANPKENSAVTARDVERDKGKPLTKYERNMMIFNWLHSLDESTFDRLA